MIVYNQTIKIDNGIHDVWLKWMQEKHIPETMSCGLFSGYTLFRLLEQDEHDGLTYVIQYRCANYSDYKMFINVFHDTLLQQAIAIWKSGFIAFDTVMQGVQ